MFSWLCCFILFLDINSPSDAEVIKGTETENKLIFHDTLLRKTEYKNIIRCPQGQRMVPCKHTLCCLKTDPFDNTAAHCLYDDISSELDNGIFTVIAGKYHVSWKHRDPGEQRLKVLNIKLPKSYVGYRNRYADDIALLELNTTIKFHSAIMPICVDWSSDYLVDPLPTAGTVVGWGQNEKNTTSEELKMAKLKFIEFTKCSDISSSDFSFFITSDKFCAGLDNGTSVLPGDSGGGITSPRNTTNNKMKYYLYGIASIRKISRNDFAGFTDIRKHLHWLNFTLISITKPRSFKKTCGIRNPINTITPSENGGIMVKQSDYPWHVGVWSVRNDEVYYTCGGSIVHTKAVLTAAHCVYDEDMKRTVDAKLIRVAVGKYRSFWNVSEGTEQKFMVIEIIIQDGYVGLKNYFNDDTAILNLDRVIVFSTDIMPICFDRGERLSLYQGLNAVGTVPGWGFMDTELLVTKFNIKNFWDCKGKLPYSINPHGWICGKAPNGTKVVNGLSGGGLTFSTFKYGIEQHFIYGIISIKPINSDDIALFVNITNQMGWIDKVLYTIGSSIHTN
ncbi:uncharacterized protein [Halyomorpha halys]|uniref:uncharacterized protein isoform X2 n=1 Tax=Halyomorpha halys TaxID=286706 RepID=UPI0034D33B71